MSEIKLIDIYSLPDRGAAHRTLFEILSERTVDQSISHKGMPNFEQHCAFVDSKPYQAWYLLETAADGVVGSVYLSQMREVGLFVFNRYWNRGFGAEVIQALHAKHPGRLLANINPKNERSIRFFQKLGFKHIQNTYELV